MQRKSAWNDQDYVVEDLPQKLVSLNIYGGKFLEQAIKKLKGIQPDTICLQECLETDFIKIQEELKLENGIFLTTTHIEKNEHGWRKGAMGLGIMSRAIGKARRACYWGERPGIPEYPENNGNHILGWETGGILFATTHFPWSPDGSEIEEQTTAGEKMIQILRAWMAEGPLLFAGDLNIPRKTPLFKKLSSEMEDFLPKEIKPTIDWELHRDRDKVKGKELDVDCFLGKQAEAKNVLTLNGISDHLGIFGTVRAQ